MTGTAPSRERHGGGLAMPAGGPHTSPCVHTVKNHDRVPLTPHACRPLPFPFRHRTCAGRRADRAGCRVGRRIGCARHRTGRARAGRTHRCRGPGCIARQRGRRTHRSSGNDARAGPDRGPLAPAAAPLQRSPLGRSGPEGALRLPRSGSGCACGRDATRGRHHRARPGH